MDLKNKKQFDFDLLFLGGIILLAFGLKLFYAQCANGEPKIFLQPLSSLVALFTGAAYQYSEGAGYLFPALDILVERSCSGINFFIMTFCMISISSLPFYRHWKSKLLAIFTWTIFAYLLTIMANGSRILIAINSLHFSTLFPRLGSEQMHLGQGIFIYLIFLITFYLTATFLNQKISKAYA